MWVPGAHTNVQGRDSIDQTCLDNTYVRSLFKFHSFSLAGRPVRTPTPTTAQTSYVYRTSDRVGGSKVRRGVYMYAPDSSGPLELDDAMGAACLDKPGSSPSTPRARVAQRQSCVEGSLPL